MNALRARSWHVIGRRPPDDGGVYAAPPEEEGLYSNTRIDGGLPLPKTELSSLSPPMDYTIVVNKRVLTAQEQRLRSQIGWSVGAFVLLLVGGTVRTVWEDYTTWRAVGPGAMPYNALGWLFQSLLRPFGQRKLWDEKVFDDPEVIATYGPLGATSFLEEELPKRRGKRPYVPTYVAPQRQAPGWGNDARMQEVCKDFSLVIEKCLVGCLPCSKLCSGVLCYLKNSRL